MRTITICSALTLLLLFSPICGKLFAYTESLGPTIITTGGICDKMITFIYTVEEGATGIDWYVDDINRSSYRRNFVRHPTRTRFARQNDLKPPYIIRPGDHLSYKTELACDQRLKKEKTGMPDVVVPNTDGKLSVSTFYVSLPIELFCARFTVLIDEDDTPESIVRLVNKHKNGSRSISHNQVFNFPDGPVKLVPGIPIEFDTCERPSTPGHHHYQ